MTRKEAAEKYARNHSQAPDKETPDWIIQDFLAGCEYADAEHREFYLLVREYFRLTLRITRFKKLMTK